MERSAPRRSHDQREKAGPSGISAERSFSSRTSQVQMSGSHASGRSRSDASLKPSPFLTPQFPLGTSTCKSKGKKLAPVMTPQESGRSVSRSPIRTPVDSSSHKDLRQVRTPLLSQTSRSYPHTPAGPLGNRARPVPNFQESQRSLRPLEEQKEVFRRMAREALEEVWGL